MKQTLKITILSVVALGIGIGGGYMLSRRRPADQPLADKGSEVIATVAGNVDDIKKGDVFGSSDAASFKDNAQGFLVSGGLDGEGSHTLLRPGGPSQTVYLTSSVTDLEKFIDMEIKVWGETFKGQKVGWLMDVGRVEIINPKGEAPTD